MTNSKEREEKMGSKRFITLADLDNYIACHYKANIVPLDSPQHIIQPSVLENFRDWLKWCDEVTPSSSESNNNLPKQETSK